MRLIPLKLSDESYAKLEAEAEAAGCDIDALAWLRVTQTDLNPEPRLDRQQLLRGFCRRQKPDRAA